MQELTKNEIQQVSGGTTAGNIAMGAAGAWASTVSGFAVGAVIGGPLGGLIGAGAGFAVGIGTMVGFALASGDDQEVQIEVSTSDE